MSQALTCIIVLLFLTSPAFSEPTVVIPMLGKKPSGDATEIDVLTGKTFSNSTGTGLIGNRPPSPIAKTGQTLCYESPGTLVNCSGTGQDGELQKGVAWPVPRFVDNGDGTVTDYLTGLIWLKNTNCIATYIPTYDGDETVGDGKVTRQNALDFISGFNLGKIQSDTGVSFYTNCGDTSNAGTSQNDWRLPNRFELESILDLEKVDPSLPAGHPFLNVESDYYWTSSYNQLLPKGHD